MEPILNSLGTRDKPLGNPWQRVGKPIANSESEYESEYESDIESESESEIVNAGSGKGSHNSPHADGDFVSVCSRLEVDEFCKQEEIPQQIGQDFWSYFEDRNWRTGRSRLKNWKKRLRTWYADHQKREEEFGQIENLKMDDVLAFCRKENIPTGEGESFFRHYSRHDWQINGRKMNNWPNRLRHWAQDQNKPKSKTNKALRPTNTNPEESNEQQVQRIFKQFQN